MSFILMRLVLQQMLFPHSREGSSNAIKKKRKKKKVRKYTIVKIYVSEDGF